jgi:hypothetical protein
MYERSLVLYSPWLPPLVNFSHNWTCPCRPAKASKLTIIATIHSIKTTPWMFVLIERLQKADRTYGRFCRLATWRTPSYLCAPAPSARH